MDLHRRDTDRADRPLYEGAGVLELETYFAGRSNLPSTVMRYRFAPGTSEGVHVHAACYAPAGTRHGVTNESAAPAELVLVFGPPAAGQPGSR